MNKKLGASASIEIKATSKAVWEALTDPEKIKIYLFGTQTTTDWKVGSSIVFKGEYQGKKYTDKGNVLQSRPHSLIEYNYWSGFSGLEDKPENYCTIHYKIERLSGEHIKLTWSQKGFANQEGQKHTQKGLPAMLLQIKELAEKP